MDLVPSEGQCKGIKVTVQDTCFYINVFILVLASCDMVLGIQWLRELGPILWNFEELSMEFDYLGKPVQLKGLVATQLIEVGSLNMFNKMESKGVVLQLLEEENTEQNRIDCEPSQEIKQLLRNF